MTDTERSLLEKHIKVLRPVAKYVGFALLVYVVSVLAIGEGPLAPLWRSITIPRPNHADPNFGGMASLEPEVRDEIYDGIALPFRAAFADARSLDDARQIRKRVLDYQDNPKALQDRFNAIRWDLIAACIFVAFWLVTTHHQKIADSTGKQAALAMRARDRMSLVPKIILASVVPLVLICLVFMVDIGRDSAAEQPWVWLVVILVTAGFEWFLWCPAKPSQV